MGVFLAVALSSLLTAPAALGKPVGDLNVDTSYKQGPSQDQQTLEVDNTGTSSQIVSDVTFTDNASGVTVTGATQSLGGDCTVEAANKIFCGQEIDSGIKNIITITTDKPITGQPGAEATYGDSGDNPQGPDDISGPLPADSNACPWKHSINRPCSDVAVGKPRLGSFFNCPEHDSYANIFLGRGYAQAGFHSTTVGDRFVEGDRWLVGVEVGNYGPDPASFKLHFKTSRPVAASYAGRESGNAGPDVCLDGAKIDPHATFGSLPSQRSEELLYSVTLTGTGPLTITVSDTNVSPVDPVGTNDLRSYSLDVGPRTDFSDVTFKPTSTGGEIKGRISTGQATDLLARSGATPPIEIGVLRRTGGKCSWMTGPTGKFSPSSIASCNSVTWLPANGTTDWTYRLSHRPPHGTYSVLVRQHLSGGGELEFDPRLHNIFTIRI